MRIRSVTLLFTAVLSLGWGAAQARANSLTLDLPFDLSTGSYNPSYGDFFYSAPGITSLPSTVTVHAGDTLTINYDYLPGQALELQNTGDGRYQQFAFSLDELPQFYGADGTYTLTLHGVKGTPTHDTFTGSLNGSGFFFVNPSGYGSLTASEFSFTGFTIQADITDINGNAGAVIPGGSFTPNDWEFQAYASVVTPLYNQTASVPDRENTLALLALALPLLIATASGTKPSVRKRLLGLRG